MASGPFAGRGPVRTGGRRGRSGRRQDSRGRGRDRFLPSDPRVEEPFRITSQLTLRVAVIGGVAIVAFVVLFLRLWSLQVLSGSQYLSAAQDNQLRTVRVEASRGPILDRNGHTLVTNHPGTAIQLWPSDLPKNPAQRADVLRRLAAVAEVPLADVTGAIARHAFDPLTPITVKEAARDDQVAFLYENQSRFPGIRIGQTYLRYYNSQSLAAQLLGYVGQINGEQLKRLQKDGYQASDKVGQAGIEGVYDRYLRGSAGTAELRVDSLGRPRGDFSLRAQPQAGMAVRLTLDIGLQRATEQALAYGIRLAHLQKNWFANGGAVVALDPRDGAVLAMASSPTFKPSVYTRRASQEELAPLVDAKTAEQANYPGINRASAGVYPAGSIFKPITAIAALQEHLVEPYATLPCTASYKVKGQVFKNWDLYANSQLTMPAALAASCDTYFYELGYRFYKLPKERGQPLQTWARRFGIGSPTGIDVGPETPGLLPTIEWRQQTYTRKSDPCCWEIDRLWKPGDSIQLAIGQKDMLVTPLQMARAYAALANGGSLVTPYLVSDVERTGGDRSAPVVERNFPAQPPEKIGMDQSALKVVREGLYLATHIDYGTSSGIFGKFPVPIAGKTGTAEKFVTLRDATGKVVNSGILNQAWWCGWGPYDATEFRGKSPIVVCALIENGGHGGETAAPVALRVFEQYFGVKAPVAATKPSD